MIRKEIIEAAKSIVSDEEFKNPKIKCELLDFIIDRSKTEES